MKRFMLWAVMAACVLSLIPAYGQEHQDALVQTRLKKSILENEKAARLLKERNQYREAAILYEEVLSMERVAMQSFRNDERLSREMMQLFSSSLINAAECNRRGNNCDKAHALISEALFYVIKLKDLGTLYDLLEESATLEEDEGSIGTFEISSSSAHNILYAIIEREWNIRDKPGSGQFLSEMGERFDRELAGIVRERGCRGASVELIRRISRVVHLDLAAIEFCIEKKRFDEALNLLDRHNITDIQASVSRRVTCNLIRGVLADLGKSDNEVNAGTLHFLRFVQMLYTTNLTSTYKALALKRQIYLCRGEYIKAHAISESADKLLETAAREKICDEKELLVYMIDNRRSLARTLQKTGESKNALEVSRHCLRLCEKTEYHRQYILPFIYLIMADIYIELGNYTNAEACIDKSENAPQDMLIERDLIWRIHTIRGRLAEKKGDLTGALDEYLKAVSFTEKYWIDLNLGRTMEECSGEKLEAYEGIIRIYHEQGKNEDALSFVEKDRARSLSAQMSPSLISMIAFSSMAIKDKSDVIRLSDTICYSDNLLRRNGESGSLLSDEEKVEIQRTLSGSYKELFSMLEERCDSDLKSLIGESVFSREKAQALMDEDSICLEYFLCKNGDVAPGTVLLWTLTKTESTCTALPISSSELVDDVRDFRMAIEGRDARWTIQAQKLYTKLIQPLEGLLDNRKRIILSPHGMLHYLPFNALIDKTGTPLIRNYSIVYMPSLDSFVSGRTKCIGKGEKTIIFSAGNASVGDFSASTCNKQEVEAIAGIFKDCTVIQNKEFIKEEMNEKLEGMDIVHFATQALCNGNSPKESYIFTNDGKYTINDILYAHMDSRLVMLGACRTIPGKIFSGDDQVAVTRAFMYAGAPSIVSSLWKVHDECIVNLVTLFYTNIAQKMDKDEALRRAELSLMANYPDPFFWSSFIITGEWK